MNDSDELFILVNRWEEFQVYQKKRGTWWAPPWIRQYLRQLDDDRYLDLTAAERGLLSDIRAEFGRTRTNLRADRKRLSQRFGYTVYASQLERLSQAGFITLCSRTVLERWQNTFWNSSIPEVEVEVEVDKELHSLTNEVSLQADDDIDFDTPHKHTNGTQPRTDEHDIPIGLTPLQPERVSE